MWKARQQHLGWGEGQKEQSMGSLQLCNCCFLPVEARNGRIYCKSQQRSEGLWRPWTTTPPHDAKREQNHSALRSLPEITEDSAKLTQFTHPVKLLWPKSRCFDYLYQEAEVLLRNFPVQATISFYEDSESEEESSDPEHHS